MKIRSVRSHLLSYPFPKPIELKYHGGTRKIVKRDAMLIRVETENGLVGYAPGEGSEKAHQAITELIAPFLIGRVLADADALRVQFDRHMQSRPDLMKTYCTVEVALYDLMGKAMGMPVSELLGGRVRDTIGLYGSAGMYMEPEGYGLEAALTRDLGFKAYKMRPAMGPEKDLATVARMRKDAGPDLGLMVDAHSWWRMGDLSYAPETVERLAGEMAKYDITWLEEPLPPNDHEAYRRLKEKDLVPLASGEHEQTEDGFLDLIQNELVDFVQMDVVCQGGYAMGRRLFAEIARRGIRFAFHSWGTELEIAAAAQVGICWPEPVVQWLEYPLYSKPGQKFMYEFPLAGEILSEPLEIKDGDLHVSRGPGLGVRVNEGVIEKYPWIPGPWSYFTLTSPPGTFAVVSDHSIPFVVEGTK